jgi:hypothetical protein
VVGGTTLFSWEEVVVTVMRGQTRVDEATSPALRDAAEMPTYSLVVSAHKGRVIRAPGTRLPVATDSLDGSVDAILVDERSCDCGNRPGVWGQRAALVQVSVARRGAQ